MEGVVAVGQTEEGEVRAGLARRTAKAAQALVSGRRGLGDLLAMQLRVTKATVAPLSYAKGAVKEDMVAARCV